MEFIELLCHTRSRKVWSMRTLTIDRFLSRRSSGKSSSSSSNSSGSTTTISSVEQPSTASASASSSSTPFRKSCSSVGREFSGSNLILEDLSMFYLRQMASSLKVNPVQICSLLPGAHITHHVFATVCSV